MRPTSLRFTVPRHRWRAASPLWAGWARYGGRIRGAYVRVGPHARGLVLMPRRGPQAPRLRAGGGAR